MANVAPTIQLFDGAIIAGDSFTCRSEVTDPGDDTWTVEISSNYGFQPQKIDLGNGKTFSFDRIYNKTGLYEITATVKDDDGGVGSGSCQLTVNRHPSSSASASSDATIHSLSFEIPLYQTPSGTSGFDPAWLTYSTDSGSTMHPSFTVYLDAGATAKYTDLSATTLTSITPGVSVVGNFGGTTPITIVVTAADGVNTKTYEIYY